MNARQWVTSGGASNPLGGVESAGLWRPVTWLGPPRTARLSETETPKPGRAPQRTRRGNCDSPPGEGGTREMKRFSKRTWVVVGIVLAVAMSAIGAFAYWTASGTGSGT